MSNKYKIAVLFGASHGINDFIAGYLLSNMSANSTNWQLNSISFLVYSIVAFGGQLPAGIIVDKSKKIKLFSLISLSLMLFAIAFSYVNIFVAILLSGIASAFIHVCGGAACYVSDNKSSTLAGIFTSPGVVGLILGGIIGTMQFHFFFVFAFVLIAILFFLIKIKIPSYSAIPETKNESLLDTHDFFMLILLLAITFRSLFWNIAHMMCFENNEWLLGIAFSAFTGKLIGGYISDKVDWRKFVFVTLIFSTILLNIGKNYLPVFCIGVALLQSAVPITLVLMQNYMQKNPATAAGLSLGVAIALAGLPTYLNQFRLIQDNKTFLLLLSIAYIFSNCWVIKKYKLL
ncbi:MAG TPA: MFS transporter [Chitinophagales bacterium]|nr:MFS transporter [Chitinophagales bacterium]MBP6153948.1 MFS transporter [Chitinophagales bacterium]HQV77837.1 MFS transporter [Chitinophagales bacterium]HQW78311.1 MFS transporter [Chitinophagales bacterium]HRB19123.1 MFS transporter [Chitinophagales bacterium]